MSCWQIEMTMILRYVIGDYGDVKKYGDEDIQTLLAVAGRYVKQDIDLTTTYTIDTGIPSISPDPVSSSDDLFINLTVLKAACLTDEWEIRSKAIIDGIAAVCGPAKMSVGGSGGMFGLLLKNGPCATYEQTKFENAIGNSSNLRAVLSPFVSNKYIPE